MLFVATLTYRPGLPAEKMREALPRRGSWQTPPGLRLLGEWVLMGEGPGRPHIIAVGETEDIAAVFAVYTTWNDLFDVSVTPAVTVEQALQLSQAAQAPRGGSAGSSS